MAGQRVRDSVGLRLLLGMCTAALVLTLVGAGSALAAPKTLHAAAYQSMKDYMQQYDKDGFAKVVDLGSAVAYRKKLASLKIVVNPKLAPVAQYDPNTNTLTFSKDPRKELSRDTGRTVWHEVTHAFEEQHGDIGIFDSAAYAERNIEYMTLVADNALMQLEIMERNAKNGATAEALRANWQNYLKQMATAAKLDPDYPPDFALMKSWFGFDVNADSITKMYLTDKAFAGDQWKNLREALAEPAVDWSGEWTTDFAWYTKLVFRVSGASAVCALWANTTLANEVSGTIDDEVFEGSYTTPDGSRVDAYRFVMAADGLSFRGSIERTVEDGKPVAAPTRWDIAAWRPGQTPLGP